MIGAEYPNRSTLSSRGDMSQLTARLPQLALRGSLGSERQVVGGLRVTAFRPFRQRAKR